MKYLKVVCEGTESVTLMEELETVDGVNMTDAGTEGLYDYSSDDEEGGFERCVNAVMASDVIEEDDKCVIYMAFEEVPDWVEEAYEEGNLMLAVC